MTLSLISDATCQAWGIDQTTPIVIKVPINDKFYLNSMSAPVAEVYQRDTKGAKKPFRIGEQLKGLLNAFVRYHWPSYVTQTSFKLTSEEFEADQGTQTAERR